MRAISVVLIRLVVKSVYSIDKKNITELRPKRRKS